MLSHVHIRTRQPTHIQTLSNKQNIQYIYFSPLPPFEQTNKNSKTSAEPTTVTKDRYVTAAMHDENNHAGNILEPHTPTAPMTVITTIATIITEMAAPTTHNHTTTEPSTANAVTPTTIANAPRDPTPPPSHGPRHDRGAPRRRGRHTSSLLGRRMYLTPGRASFMTRRATSSMIPRLSSTMGMRSRSIMSIVVRGGSGRRFGRWKIRTKGERLEWGSIE